MRTGDTELYTTDDILLPTRPASVRFDGPLDRATSYPFFRPTSSW